ncbi:MAG: DUF4157 domain-containing protein [Gemmatimonadaceae bacterium]
MGRDRAILAAVIGRPLALPPPLVERFPELAAARWRRGGLPVRIAGLFLGRASAAAITLWRTVFLATHARLDAELLLHELRHVHQFQASPAFPLLYVWESLFRGYHRNRFEADARAYAARRLRGSPEFHA